MPKLFTKKWIFSFLTSFFVTLLVGFFIWNLFVFSNNGILRFSTASLVPNYSGTSITHEINVDQIEVADQAPQVDVEVVATQETRQDILDDIQEELDVLSQKLQALADQQKQDDKLALEDKDQDNDQSDTDEDDNQNENNTEIVVCTGQININTASAEDLDKIISVGPVTAQKIIEARPFYLLNDLLKVSGIGGVTLQKIIEQGCAYVDYVPSGGGGGGGISEPVVYPKILISEVQISPIVQRFIELYNPNSTDVDLTGWYLQRKDANDVSWGSFVSATNFSGKTIPANGYFLISRELPNSDILFAITLSENNSIALKNPNREIVDQMSFGAIDDNKSIGRKSDEQDTNNDSADFEIDTPTPKAQNTVYVVPLPPSLENIEITKPPSKIDYFVGDSLDIFGLVVTGNYNNGSTQVLPITLDNVTGFDSASPSVEKVLTVTFQEKIANFFVNIIAREPEPPVENMLTNEFFNEAWEGTALGGNPVGWIWGKRGGVAIEDPPLITGKQSFYHEPYSSPQYLKQLSKELEAGKTYYVRVWAKGTGKIKAGVEVAGDVVKEPTFYDSLNNADWTEINYSYTLVAGEETPNGGVTLKLTRYNSTDERLVIGAVWLGTAESPAGWPL